MSEIKQAIRETFTEPDFVQSFQAVMAPVVEAAVARAVAGYKAELSDLREEIDDTREQLREANQRIDDLQALSKQNSLVISGVPEAANETTDRLVLDVAKAAGVTLSPDDLDRSHRIGKSGDRPGDKPRAIVAKFVTHNIRQKLFEARKEKSANRVGNHPVLTRDVLTSVYIAECLTSKNQTLLYVARQLRKQHKLWAAYTTNGRVKIKVTDKDQAKVITCLDDFEKLLGNDPILRDILEAASRSSPRDDAANRGQPRGGGAGPGSNDADNAGHGPWQTVPRPGGRRAEDKGRRPPQRQTPPGSH